MLFLSFASIKNYNKPYRTTMLVDLEKRKSIAHIGNPPKTHYKLSGCNSILGFAAAELLNRLSLISDIYPQIG